MNKKLIVSLVIVLLITLLWSNPGYAQEDSGYPIDDPTEPPAPTTVPTQAPTKPPTQQPTQAPTESVAPTVVPTLTPLPTDPNTGNPPPTDNPTLMPTPPNAVCGLTRLHPALLVLSYQFEMAYEILVSYYCDMNLGVGEIALGLITLDHIEDEAVTLEDLFSLRLDAGLGWGEIWYRYGLVNPMSSNGQDPSPAGGFQQFHRRQRPQNQMNSGQAP